MSTYNRYTSLTTKGNLGLVAAGRPVVLAGTPTHDFPAGQPILYNPDDNTTINAAAIASASKVAFGVGYNPNGGYMATEIRHLGHVNLDLCKTGLNINVAKPACSLPQVVDFEFGCTTTGEDYGLSIDIDDWVRRSFFDEGVSGPILYNASSAIAGCSSCSEEENGHRIACELVSKINGTFYNHFPGMNQLGLNKDLSNVHPIKALLKFDQITTFTLTADNVTSDCGQSCGVKAIKDFSATGLTTVVFTNVTDPKDNDRTLVEQLPYVVAQLNAALEGKGGAILKQVDCCSYQIVVSTCLAAPVMRYHDNASVSSATVNSFGSFTQDDFCAGCDVQTPSQFAHGIRIIVDPVDLPCHCDYPDGNGPSYFGRTIDIQPFGDGWNPSAFRVVEVQKQVIGQGQGYFVQDTELFQSHGGPGFNYPYENQYDKGTRYPRPMAHSALSRAVTADCEQLYCVWTVLSNHLVTSGWHSQEVYNQPNLTYINVPIGDTVTVGALQTVLTALAARNACNTANIECIP